MVATRDNLIFSLERWPEVGVKVEFALTPTTFSPYLEATLRLDGESLVEATPQLASDFVGVLKLRLYGQRLKVHGQFAVMVEMACHRCLTVFPHKLSDHFEESVDLRQGNETIPNEDQELTINVVDNHFDLTPLLVERLWLAWPIKVLCQPDCLGLCLNCGANLNEGLCACGQSRAIRH
ncbi:MAG: DUF177 domain-containing protein [Deltaproteobacteria bacterium]|jgi:uncharacterized protein|nr:DUF177 domain-containing protein [Deltaproteobacteria bacterium]